MLHNSEYPPNSQHAENSYSGSQSGSYGQAYGATKATNAWSTWDADASDHENRELLQTKRNQSSDETQKSTYVLNDVFRNIKVDQKSQARRVTSTTQRVLEDYGGSLAPPAPLVTASPFADHQSHIPNGQKYVLAGQIPIRAAIKPMPATFVPKPAALSHEPAYSISQPSNTAVVLTGDASEDLISFD